MSTKTDIRNEGDSEDDESDQDYKPDGEGGNVSEEEESGDEESGGDEEDEPPLSKRQKIEPSAEPSAANVDADAIWADFKKETEPVKKLVVEPAKATPAPSPIPVASRPQSSLAGILGKINKKDKVSVLEKSRLDWNNFKKAEGIEEDLQTHNKGKDGFLEKRDFLERTDVRQFELEKAMRTIKRSNR